MSFRDDTKLFIPMMMRRQYHRIYMGRYMAAQLRFFMREVRIVPRHHSHLPWNELGRHCVLTMWRGVYDKHIYWKICAKRRGKGTRCYMKSFSLHDVARIIQRKWRTHRGTHRRIREQFEEWVFRPWNPGALGILKKYLNP